MKNDVRRARLVALVAGFVACCGAGAMPICCRALDAAYEPVASTGYNQDGIAEASPAGAHTSAALDNSDHALYSVAYGNTFGSGTGLPDDGRIVQGDRTYQLQAYDANNALALLPGEAGLLTLATPAAYASVSLLGFATEATDGGADAFVVLGFTDGSSATYSVAIPDWFAGSNPVIAGFDRTGRTTDTPEFLVGQPQMYAFDLDLDCADFGKSIESVSIADQSAFLSRINVFAMSAAAIVDTVAPITGERIVFVGNTITMGDATPGGAWSSDDESVATVDVDGIVTGVSEGVATITYTVALPCDTAAQSKVVRVRPADTIFYDAFDPE
jgi:Big-like domain-containing protein